MGSSIVKELYEAGKLTGLPKFIPTNMCYEVVSGSVCYGVSGEVSDWDIVSFCIPSKVTLFPHLAGVIQGFGKQKKRFSTWQKHHIDYKEKEYDITVYSIVDFFNLCMDCNPNMLSYLYVPDNCVLHSTQIGNLVRENRSIFLSKKVFPRFRGYAYSQMKKMENKTAVGKRIELIEKHGYDTKFAYNIIRLIGEVEQLLTTGDMNLQLDKERLKAIRRGEWTMEQVKQFFTDKERDLEALYNSSTLPYSPDEEKIKALLIRCIEIHYDDISECIVIPGRAEAAIQKIKEICDGI